MTATRSNKQNRAYNKHLSKDSNVDCPFCRAVNGHEPHVEETGLLLVIRNKFPYSIWDSQGVLDHLMIIPRQHTEKLGDLDAQAAVEFIALADKYESMGYNLYARSPKSNVKTVPHQHTHLIKLDGKLKRLLFVISKPFYFRMSRG